MTNPERQARRRLTLPGWKRALLIAALAGIASSAGAGVWVHDQLQASLPQLDGRVTLPGLSSPVVVTRDGLGIPTITGLTREDVARATGFVHAQDRFFQMDLARRRAAGELSALVGGAALAVDRQVRIHRFRDEAERAAGLLAERDRRILDAYTSGVNAGLRALEAPPFEYLVLRQTPVPWRPEDTLLVVLSMFVTLQDEDGTYEATIATMRDVLPAAMVEFLAPRGTQWDAPLVGEAFDMPPIPGPEIYDLRTRRRGKPGIDLPARDQDDARLPRGRIGELAALFGGGSPVLQWKGDDPGGVALGSNNWAVSGQLTRDGRPLLANDMHLPVRVPNTWYRAILQWQDPAIPSQQRRLAGVTLPGVPALVAGSNGDIAWGFTNTYADWSDIVLLETDAGHPHRYRTPAGWRAFDRHVEVIEVAGQPAQEEVVPWTIWGPLIEPDHRGRPRAYRWVAHDASRLARSLTPLEDARTVEDAFDEANGLGAPGQNLVVVDRAGSIGWSIYGAIPRRIGEETGRFPASWADGARGWNGWLSPSEYPRIVDPVSGRLWTANARVVDGEMLDRLGDGSYEIGSRATIIRDRLMAQEQFTIDDLLAIQLDTAADFLARWRGLLLRTLSAATAEPAERTLVRQIVEREWSGQAAADSVAYRLTRAFREAVSQRVLRFVLAEAYEADPTFDYTNVRRRDGPIWALVTQEPMHLLDPQFETWQELRLDAIDEVIEEATALGDLRDRVWSEYNVAVYRHPLSRSLPFLSGWLDMPVHPLPGDAYTPRVHWGTAAASERMIVSPGHEEDGILHMPTGQSGHPLSPFYANSHEAWVKGTPTPFLAGPPEHTLTMEPRQD